MILTLRACNLLRLCGQGSLREDNGNLEKRALHRKKAKWRRIRTVMQDLIYMASRITVHARKMFFPLVATIPGWGVWQSLYRSFMAPATQGDGQPVILLIFN
jgi:hypothetical protein